MIPTLLITFFALLCLGVPIAVALGLSSLAGLLFCSNIPLIVVVQRMFVSLDSFPLMAVPLYMLAGYLMSSGGISRRIIGFANSLVGNFTGGLAQVNILTSMIFAGISGSAVADTAGIGNIMIPSMIQHRYPRKFSAAVGSIASTIGIVIPPSIPMVIIGAMLGVSVGKLFLGGIIPGLLIGFSLMLTAYLMARRAGLPRSGERLNLRQVGKNLADAFWSLLMPLIIIGGIVLGIVTPTEAGAIAVLYALFAGSVIYRELKLDYIVECLWQTGIATAKVFFIIATAGLFTWLLTANGFPLMVAHFLTSITDSPGVMMLLIVLIIILITTFMESLATLILLLPILFPVSQNVGIDPIYFGVMIVVAIGLGLVTPPVGLCLFVASDIGKVSIAGVSRALIPFMATVVLILLLLLLFPALVTFVPEWLM